MTLTQTLTICAICGIVLMFIGCFSLFRQRQLRRAYETASRLTISRIVNIAGRIQQEFKIGFSHEEIHPATTFSSMEEWQDEIPPWWMKITTLNARSLAITFSMAEVEGKMIRIVPSSENELPKKTLRIFRNDPLWRQLIARDCAVLLLAIAVGRKLAFTPLQINICAPSTESTSLIWEFVYPYTDSGARHSSICVHEGYPKEMVDRFFREIDRRQKIYGDRFTTA